MRERERGREINDREREGEIDRWEREIEREINERERDPFLLGTGNSNSATCSDFSDLIFRDHS